MTRRDTRGAVLKAAEQLFLEKRFDQVTLDDVCAKAHVGKGTIYRHFDCKEELWAHVLLAGMDELNRLIEEEIASVDAPGDALPAVAHAIHDHYARRHNLRRAFHSEVMRGRFPKGSFRKRMHTHRTATLDLIERVLQSGVDAGIYRTDMPTRPAARLFLTMMRETCRRQLHASAVPVEMDHVLGLFTRGMQAS